MNYEPRAAIIDYGMGNLRSVLQACSYSGLSAEITRSPAEVAAADGIILPGVGAFGQAMDALKANKLDEAIKAFIAQDKPFFGICLGLQLLMTESFEFGRHQGLGIIPGSVIRLQPSDPVSLRIKVPQVGWNRIWKNKNDGPNADHSNWHDGLFRHIEDGEFMYFVHSYYVVPENESFVMTRSHYGNTDFCSGLRHGNIFGCQFHPERSGPAGLRFYQQFAAYLRQSTKKPVPPGASN